MTLPDEHPAAITRQNGRLSETSQVSHFENGSASGAPDHAMSCVIGAALARAGRAHGEQAVGCPFRWKATYHAIGGGVDDRLPDNKSRMSLGRLWRRLDPQTRYGVVLTIAGSAVYGIIGAVTLPWYMAVLLALVALVLGTTFTLIKRLRREKHPRRE